MDEGNQSSAGSSPSLNHDEILHDEIPHDEIPDMEEMLIDVGIEEVDPAPKQKAFPWPPTPSDSAARLDTHRDDVLHAKPLLQYTLPNILDSVEDGGTSSDGWEKIHPKDLDEERSSSPTPPTPPAKDKPIDGGGLSIEIPAVLSAIPTENRRESLPPAYTSHVDDGFEDIDMYCEPEKPTATTTADDQANVNNEHVKNNDDDDDNNDLSARQSGDFDIDTGVSDNPWHVRTPSDVAASEADAAKMQAEEAAAERVRKEEVEAEAERIQKKAENERIRREEDERKRQEAEETKRKEAEYERIRKEAEDERSRQEAEDERIRKEAEELRKETERKRKADELAERKKKEEADAALRKQKQEEAKRQEAAEQKRKDEEAAKKKEAEEAERKRKAEEDAEQRRKDEDALKKKMEEDAEQRRKDEDTWGKKMEEDAERKRQDEDALKKKKEEEEQEAAKKKKEAEEQEAREIEKQRQDEAATHAQNGDTPGDQATEEKEDDSKTVHGVDIFGAQHQQGPSEADDVQDSTTPLHGDYTEEESVVSTATIDPPQEAKVRLERMMILRAQMVEVEKLLDELKGRGLDETSPAMKAAEKTLRKFQRQADRRYDAGMLFFKLCRCIIVNKFRAGVQLTKDSVKRPFDISLGTVDPQMAGVRIEENLERLLTPTSRSISFKLTFGPISSAKKQKPVVLKTLMTFVSVFHIFLLGR